MSFINEKVSEQDIEKYGLREINKTLGRDENTALYWTIDRERDIYLREIGSNWQDPPEKSFSFYWKGHLLTHLLRNLEFSGEHDGKGSQIWGLTSNTTRKSIWLPPELEEHREQITNDLKEALLAYKGSGIFSTLTEYSAQFEF